MLIKSSYQINQKQLHKLILNQSMKQSLFMLQTDLVDLTAYLQELSMSNPLFDVNPSLTKRDVELLAIPQNSLVQDQSLYSYLLEQIRFSVKNNYLRRIVIYLIENLDEHGYLLLSDAEILQELSIDNSTLKEAKDCLYDLKPSGVGAQSLKECLILQLQYKKATTSNLLALSLLEDYFSDVVNHNWPKIAHSLKISVKNILSAFSVIQSLKPYPYWNNYKVNKYLIPELIMINNKGKLSLHITRNGYPQIVFAEETYNQLKNSTDQEARIYIRTKYQEYQNLRRNLNHRLQTIAMVGRCIISLQTPFLLRETRELKPLLLKDIANKLNISISTVSRTINGKYLQTDFGMFELKYFFNRQASPTSHQSISQVQTQLQQLIKQEDANAPLSDQKLVTLLAKQNINLSRRTVTKYRNKLGISNANQRKKFIKKYC